MAHSVEVPSGFGATESADLKLNLGSGTNAVSGWVNVDKSIGPWLTRHKRIKGLLKIARVVSPQQFNTEWPSSIQKVSLTSHFPWKDGSVQAIYSSHMLEHLTRNEVKAFLANCFRVLRPGGIIRLALPDLEEAVQEYLRMKQVGKPDSADALIESLYMAPEVDGSVLHKLAVRFFHRPHKWMYDGDSIKQVLQTHGFEGIRRCEFQSGECPDLTELENRPGSLFVEAVKPLESPLRPENYERT